MLPRKANFKKSKKSLYSSAFRLIVTVIVHWRALVSLVCHVCLNLKSMRMTKPQDKLHFVGFVTRSLFEVSCCCHSKSAAQVENFLLQAAMNNKSGEKLLTAKSRHVESTSTSFHSKMEEIRPMPPGSSKNSRNLLRNSTVKSEKHRADRFCSNEYFDGGVFYF